jgi:hypothetical protein
MGPESSGSACTSGSMLATLPACASPATSPIDVPAGCAPTVDGTYHAGEWGDAVCVSVGSDPVYLKYSGSTLYLAWAMTPTCGCGAQIAFNTDGATALDGSQFDLAIVDDPFGSMGDAEEAVSTTTGTWGSAQAVPSGIEIANPPNQPTLVTYELAIPLSQLGIAAGQAHTVGFVLSHNLSGNWPAGATASDGAPSTPSDWGNLMSSADWK